MQRSSGRLEDVDVALLDKDLVIYRHARLLVYINLADCIIHTSSEDKRWVSFTSMLKPVMRYKLLPTEGQKIQEWNTAIVVAGLNAKNKLVTVPPAKPNPLGAGTLGFIPWDEVITGFLLTQQSIMDRKEGHIKDKWTEAHAALVKFVQVEATNRIAYLESKVAWLSYQHSHAATERDHLSEQLMIRRMAPGNQSSV